MTETADRTFTGDFRRFFLRGLVVVLPSVLTLWIVVKAYQFVDNAIAEPVNRSVRLAMAQATPHWAPLTSSFEPTEDQVGAELVEMRATSASIPSNGALRLRLRRENIASWWATRWYMDLIGIMIAIVAVYVAGRLLGGFFGRRLYRKVETVITSLPVFKQVYPSVKQVVDFLFSDERPITFNRVVAVEYPRKGIWSVGFLTGSTLRALNAKAVDGATVFIPSSPTPFTGYTITVPRAETIELPMTVDEAIRFAVSGGVLIPEHQRMPEGFRAALPGTDGGPDDGPSEPPAESPAGEDARGERTPESPMESQSPTS